MKKLRSIFLLYRVTRWRKWRWIAGWLLGSIALVVSLSACVSQTGRGSPTDAPTMEVPASTVIQETEPSPAILSTPSVPLVAETRLGFNVQGWF